MSEVPLYSRRFLGVWPGEDCAAMPQFDDATMPRLDGEAMPRFAE